MAFCNIKFDLEALNKNRTKIHNDLFDSVYYGIWAKRYGNFIDESIVARMSELKSKEEENTYMYIFNKEILNSLSFIGPGNGTKFVISHYYINEDKRTVVMKIDLPYGLLKSTMAVKVRATDGDIFNEEAGKLLCVLKLLCATTKQYKDLVEMAGNDPCTFIKNLIVLLQVLTGSTRVLRVINNTPVDIRPKKVKIEGGKTTWF